MKRWTLEDIAALRRAREERGGHPDDASRVGSEQSEEPTRALRASQRADENDDNQPGTCTSMDETEAERQERREKYKAYQLELVEKRKNDPRWRKLVNLAARIRQTGHNLDNRDRRMFKAAEEIINLLVPMNDRMRRDWGSITLAELAVAYGMAFSADATNYLDSEEWPHLTYVEMTDEHVPDMSKKVHWTDRESPFDDEDNS